MIKERDTSDTQTQQSQRGNGSELGGLVSAFPHYEIRLRAVLSPNEFWKPVKFEFDVSKCASVDHTAEIIWLDGYER